MNERIVKLVTEADTHAWNIAEKYVVSDGCDDGEVNYLWEDAFRKKFAELIVRECADIVANKVTLETNEDYREGFHRAQQFIWQDINKHFGVSDAVL
jgi:hypothetical protein